MCTHNQPTIKPYRIYKETETLALSASYSTAETFSLNDNNHIEVIGMLSRIMMQKRKKGERQHGASFFVYVTVPIWLNRMLPGKSNQ